MKSFSKLTLQIMAPFLVLFVLLCFVTSSSAFDYDNNIGFIKDVPQELEEAFPMCEKFIGNIKWFHQIPVGKRRAGSWFGKALVDVYERDVKQRRALLLWVHPNKHWDRTHLITVEQYFDMELETHLKTADQIYQRVEDDDIYGRRIGLKGVDNDSDIFWISQRPIRIGINNYNYQLNEKGFPRLTLSHLTKKVCVPSPVQNAVWILEPSKPFISETLMDTDTKAKHALMVNLFERDCPTLMKSHLPVYPEICSFYLKKVPDRLRKSTFQDTDGDSKLDYVL